MNYLLKFNFESIKITNSGGIKGYNGSAECDCSIDLSYDEIMQNQNVLFEIAHNSLIENPKVKGKVTSIRLTELSAVESA